MAHLTEMLLKAHAERRQVSGADADEPKDISEVYRIHDEVYAGLATAATPVAWKVGGPSDKVDTTITTMLTGRGLTSPARVAASDFQIIGVEAEVAVQLVNNDWELRVALELCDARLADWKTA